MDRVVVRWTYRHRRVGMLVVGGGRDMVCLWGMCLQPLVRSGGGKAAVVADKVEVAEPTEV